MPKKSGGQIQKQAFVRAIKRFERAIKRQKQEKEEYRRIARKNSKVKKGKGYIEMDIATFMNFEPSGGVFFVFPKSQTKKDRKK